MIWNSSAQICLLPTHTPLHCPSGHSPVWLCSILLSCSGAGPRELFRGRVLGTPLWLQPSERFLPSGTIGRCPTQPFAQPALRGAPVLLSGKDLLRSRAWAPGKAQSELLTHLSARYQLCSECTTLAAAGRGSVGSYNCSGNGSQALWEPHAHPCPTAERGQPSRAEPVWTRCPNPCGCPRPQPEPVTRSFKHPRAEMPPAPSGTRHRDPSPANLGPRPLSLTRGGGVALNLRPGIVFLGTDPAEGLPLGPPLPRRLEALGGPEELSMVPVRPGGRGACRSSSGAPGLSPSACCAQSMLHSCWWLVPQAPEVGRAEPCALVSLGVPWGQAS